MRIKFLIVALTIFISCLGVKNLTQSVKILRRDPSKEHNFKDSKTRLKTRPRNSVNNEPDKSKNKELVIENSNIASKSDYDYIEYGSSEYIDHNNDYSELSDDDYWNMVDRKTKGKKIVVDKDPISFDDTANIVDSIFNKCQSSFQRACLRAHNLYRSKHRSPPLIQNEELQRRAQNYAEYLASSNSFEHSGAVGYGENLAYSWSSSISSLGNNCESYGLKYSKSWYNEINEYSFKSPSFSSGTGHFTQLVWKATTDLGCGIAMSRDDKVYAVCNYTPPGNFNNKYEENVLPK